MAGTKAGGLATAAANKAKYGEDYYKKIGAMGGIKRGSECIAPKGFAANREVARSAGAKGGRVSRLPKK